MTTPFPLQFNQQNAQNSILDVTGLRQTYLGNTYILPFTGHSLSDENENVLGIITNPSGSGKGLFLYTRKVSTDNNTVLVRFYLNPTVSVTGSATTAVNLRSGYSTLNSSIAKCYLSPTISANGTFVAVLPATIYSITSNVLIVIDPGATILFTGQQTASGTTNAFVDFSWYEI